jgi:hypothetical protein
MIILSLVPYPCHTVTSLSTYESLKSFASSSHSFPTVVCPSPRSSARTSSGREWNEREERNRAERGDRRRKGSLTLRSLFAHSVSRLSSFVSLPHSLHSWALRGERRGRVEDVSGSLLSGLYSSLHHLRPFSLSPPLVSSGPRPSFLTRGPSWPDEVIRRRCEEARR